MPREQEQYTTHTRTFLKLYTFSREIHHYSQDSALHKKKLSSAFSVRTGGTRFIIIIIIILNNSICM